MNDEQLVKTIKDLQQYLIDVWDARELFRIAFSFHERVKSSEGISEKTMNAQYRALADDKEKRLFASYGCAITEVNRVLEEVMAIEGADILVDRMRIATAQLVDSTNGDLGWLSFVQGPLDMFRSKAEDFHDTTELNEMQKLWRFIEEDLSFYIGKVVTEIDRIRFGTAKNGEMVVIPKGPDRIRWNDTAALLGYLFHELEATGYITPPQRKENGDWKPNWSAIARTLHAAFDIRKEGGDPVTLAALTQALKPEGDRDIKGGKAAFKIVARRG